MNRHKTVAGEVIEFPDPSPAIANYLVLATKAAHDPNVTVNDLIELIYHTKNPLLDTTILPGRALVTKAIFANPIYHVFSDLLDVKRVQLGLLDPVAAKESYTLTVTTVATQLGISESAVKLAIKEHRLAAIRDGGQWWINPNSVASYRVSNRGPKGKGTRKKVTRKPARRVR
jgi:excisionase family DNA binding protein